AHRWIGGYFRSVLDHYRFGDDHMKTTKGYEYYAKMTDKIHTYGDEKDIDFFVDLQVWGTPEQCYEKILDVRRRVANDHFVGVFSYAGRPAAGPGRTIALLAAEVMPARQKRDPESVAAGPRRSPSTFPSTGKCSAPTSSPPSRAGRLRSRVGSGCSSRIRIS